MLLLSKYITVFGTLNSDRSRWCNLIIIIKNKISVMKKDEIKKLLYGLLLRLRFIILTDNKTSFIPKRMILI